ASADVWDKCLGRSDAAVIEVAPDLSLRTIFQYGGPLEKFAGRVAVLPDGRIVLVGQMTMPFDLEPYVKADASMLSGVWAGFTGELFTNDRKTLDAFVVLLDRDGHFLVDRVIRDLRGRSMRATAVRHDGSLLFGGLANGVSGWLGIIDTQ